jgi:hypothetical protein
VDQAGLQPSTLGIDFFNMEVQERFLVGMNIGYLLITCALYFFMRRREVRVPARLWWGLGPRLDECGRFNLIKMNHHHHHRD